MNVVCDIMFSDQRKYVYHRSMQNADVQKAKRDEKGKVKIFSSMIFDSLTDVQPRVIN